MNPCPSCGRPRLKSVVMDYERNRLLADGQIILLSPQETDLMSIFVADPAFTFTVPELADKVWGNRWPTDIHASVGGLVLRLRRKLAATRLRIVAVPRHGYGLRQSPASSQFAAGQPELLAGGGASAPPGDSPTERAP